MAYILPQVKVFQEFEAAAVGVDQPMNAFVFGPNYHLFRYSEASEKALINIGTYVPATGITAVWPNRPAGSVVDQSWTRVFIDDARLEYFIDYAGSGASIVALEDYTNRIYSSTLKFATYGSDARSSEFRERDVQVGDGVSVRGTACGVDFELKTKVRSLINDIVASIIGTPEVEAANTPAVPVLVSDINQTAGDTGTVLFAEDASLYDGIADGDIIESYFLAVTVAGEFGTAQLRVTTSSGNDQPVDPIIPTDGVAVAVGARGLTTTFSASGSATPFETGQIFRVDINQAWTQPVITADPTASYTGSADGTYIIEVTTGAVWADGPRVLVRSTGTLDSSGPYTVADDTYVTLPTGVKFKFSTSTGLTKGDMYYIEVTAATIGAIHTLELTNSLPPEALGICSDSATEAIPELTVSLSIIKDIEVPEATLAGIANFTQSATQIILASGITAKDTTWYDDNGVLLDMDVIDGTTFTQYRSTNISYTAVVGSVTSVSEVEALLGPAVSDNPLALGVYKAVQNSNSSDVMFMATSDESLAAYSVVLEAIYDRKDVYGLIPLTHVKNIQDAVLAHCLEASTADRGRWRVMWAGAVVAEETVISQLDSSGDILFGTILDDPDTTGTQYTILKCDEATFITDGAVAGNIVRALYYTDPVTGAARYSEYVVDAVITEEEIRLVSGPDNPVSVPSRFEIWKTNTNDDVAQQVISLAGSFSNRRARVVFPDRISNGGTTYDSMYLCCSLAGLRSGVQPHQGLTNVEIVGYDNVSRTTDWLGGRLLNLMAENGVWIVTEDTTGTIYSRHQLTTDPTDINSREDSMVSNFDNISYQFLNFFVNSRYIGRRNITDRLIAQLGTDFDGLVNSIQYESDTEALGPQIIGAEIITLERHPTLLDHVIATVRVDMPEPFNNFNITLIAAAQ